VCLSESARDDDVIIDPLSLAVGGNFILLAIIRLSMIETNREGFSHDRDN